MAQTSFDPKPYSLTIRNVPSVGANPTFGAGVIIGRNADGTLRVVTARHVIGQTNPTSLSLTDASGARYYVKSAHYPKDGDFAALDVVPPGHAQYAVASLAANGAKVPQELSVMGTPDGKAFQVAPGTNAGAYGSGFLVDAPQATYGDSGGGVWGPHGTLYGIADALVQGPKGQTLLSPLAASLMRSYLATMFPQAAVAPRAVQAVALTGTPPNTNALSRITRRMTP